MKILLADDEPVSRRLLEAALTDWGYEVAVANDGVEARQLLQGDDPPRLAILDWVMPGIDGVQVCREVREQAREPYVYIILLTCRDSKEDLIQGLEAGADDYVTKPFDPHELKVRLRTGRRILDLQSQLIAAREALHVQATHDALTGLWNRPAILDLVQQEFSRARRAAGPLALVMVDLDHFKRINDTYGHAAGDAVLCQVAARMCGAIRPYDSLGRYGGEEFLMVLPGCDPVDAAGLAERLRARIAGQPMDTPDGAAIPVTISLGVAATADATHAEAEPAIRAADDALYQAKRRGRNRVEHAPSAAAPCPPPPQTSLGVPHGPDAPPAAQPDAG